MTLRILYVSHSFPVAGRPLSNVGGMQRVAVDLYRALASHPEVEVIPLLLETSWRWTGLRTPPFLLRLLRRIPSIVQAQQIDVVLFSSMVTASVAPVLARSIRAAGAITAAIPVGRDVTLPNPLYQRYVPRVLEALDVILPISRATAATCVERGASSDRVHIVPCGIDLPRVDRVPPGNAARSAVLSLVRQHGAPAHDETTRILLSVGRHQERKGFHWFAEQVLPEVPDAVYLVAGDGPMKPRIAAAAERAGVADRIVLPGRVTDEFLATLQAGSDLFIMPNIPVAGDMEGFGVVMLEAGAAGLVTVAADLEGIRDVVTEGVNGHLVPSRDGSAFATAIAKYPTPEASREAGARAAHHVREHFGWEGVVESYLEILRRASEGGARLSP